MRTAGRLFRTMAPLVALYAAVSLVMAGPIVNYGALKSSSYAGDSRLIIWTLAWANHALLTGHPLFDANVFYPAPHSLAYNEHLFGLSLFTLPIYALTKNPVLAYNVVWLLSFPLSALSGHALLYRYTGSTLASITGSLIFSFSFYKMLHGHGHLHLVWTWLLPLSILCLERWRQRPTIGRAALWGLTVLLQALTSWYIAVMLLLVQGTVFVVLLPSLKRERHLTRSWPLVLIALLIAAALLPFAWPYRDLPPVARTEVAGNAADLVSYVIPPQNTWVGRLWLEHVGRQPRWIWGERTLFLGWLALILAGWGLYDVWRRGDRYIVAVYGTVTALGIALSLGPAIGPSGEAWTPFRVLTLLPGMSGFRAPARFGLLVTLGVAVFGAFGARLLQRRSSNLVVVGLLPLMLSEWFLVAFPGGKPQPFPIPPIYSTDAVRRARALVSLPEYRGTPEWGFGSDYLYFSTAHWRPIVNGFGRSEPPEHFRVVSHMMAFPGPNNARSMRSLGVELVVLHSNRYPDGAKNLLTEAVNSPDYDLLTQIGGDYLFKVRQ